MKSRLKKIAIFSLVFLFIFGTTLTTAPKKEIKDSKIPIALTTFLDAHPEVKTIYLHLDRDKTGRLCTETLQELLKKDYEIVDDPPPVGKDFNDFLLSYLGIERPKPARERRDAR